MSENFKQPAERPDRVLGDEWVGWDGKDETIINEGPSLFISFCLFVITIFDAVLLLLYYLTKPRLLEFHHLIPPVALTAVVIFIALGIIFWLQLLLTVTIGKNFFAARGQAYIVFDFVFTRVFKLARLCRISRDRMGNSFVKVSNAVVRAVDKTLENKKLLILLPRCLTKDTLQQIHQLKERFPIEIFTVSGGELARKKVKEVCPSAIIGVACERDLVSGIRDVGSKIPVIGIPNKRPHGPCKDTLVDIGEITKAVEFYYR